MKNKKTKDKIIYLSILTILICCVIIGLKHPISKTLVIIAILPLLYLGVIKIGNLKVKSVLNKILSIIYGIISIGMFLICALSGFVEMGTIYISMKNIVENSPLIIAFMLLSTSIYNKSN